MRKMLVFFRALLRLGVLSILGVGWYRARRLLGLYPATPSNDRVFTGSFFASAGEVAVSESLGDTPWKITAAYFGHRQVPVTNTPPKWHIDPVGGHMAQGQDLPWYRVPPLADNADIKNVWEASRFPWLIPYAAAAADGDRESLNRLNAWLADWVEKNPPFSGINWTCGQETGIRVLHLSMAAVILGQSIKPTPAVQQVVREHCQRISQTVSYALAQDNNHGISEAAALFVGGSWLRIGGDRQGDRYARLGRKLLLDRVERLIDAEGGFSMYSVSYHREVLDVLSMVEVWRHHHVLPEFPQAYLFRVRLAVRWLWELLPLGTTQMPGIGAVDGSRLFFSESLDHRDAGDSLCLAAALFGVGEVGHASERCSTRDLGHLLGIPAVRLPDRKNGIVFDRSGFAILRRRTPAAACILRFPRFRFRPTHADALHVDLWLKGQNLLCDGGSYSYADAQWHAYFTGTESHNTIQFDGRDQMPRLGRFLFGDWLQTNAIESLAEDGGSVSFGAGYRDRRGASHFRRLRLSDEVLRVEDEVAGFQESAVVRWRLTPDRDWRLEGEAAVGGGHRLVVSANVPISRMQLVEGWESRYYMQKTPLRVLEVEIREPGQVVSEYRWTK